MAKTKRRAAAGDEGADTSKTMKTYRVKPGNSITLGEQGDDGNVMVTYGPGEEVEMSEADADARPWAVEAVDAKKDRPGQTSRLKKQISDLQDRIKQLESDSKAKTTEDPEREKAIESLKNRGDNFIGRGEPEVGKVPPDAIDAHEAGLLQAEAGDAGRKPLSDEVGMKGLEREHGGGETHTTSHVAGATESVPSSPQPGESVKPGESKPAKK